MYDDTVVLILAHNLAPLRDLLRLMGSSFRVIVHLDGKASATMDDLPRHVSVLEPRHDVFWGGFSMFRAIRALIDAAYREVPDFSRAVLISGDSLPLLECGELHQVFADQNREYIGLCEIANDRRLRGLSMEEARLLSNGSELPWRFQNFCFYDNNLLNPKTIAAVQFDYDVADQTASHIRGSVKALNELLVQNIPQRPDLYDKFFYGEAWWALSRSVLDLVVDDIHATVHSGFFQFLQAPEEHFIQTLLGNKKRALQSMRKQIVCSPVFVDHNDAARSASGHYALASDRFCRARTSGPYLFARKYDPGHSPEIAEAIGRGSYFEMLLANFQSHPGTESRSGVMT